MAMAFIKIKSQKNVRFSLLKYKFTLFQQKLGKIVTQILKNDQN